MPRAALLLSRILDANPALAAWEARRRREEQVIAIVRRGLPRPLAERVRVADGEGAVLQLAVEAGAVAAILRQRSPDLLAALQHEGFEFRGIQVRVHVRPAAETRRKTFRIRPDSASIAPLARLASQLPAGALKTALARFVRRVG
jgi:hypothetical protein